MINYWLGAGRTKIGQPVDYAVGLDLHVSIGDRIVCGKYDVNFLKLKLKQNINDVHLD